jgi:hypothetical protein
LNRRVTLAAGAYVAPPGWEAVIVQVPPRPVRRTIVPRALHTPAAVNDTGSRDDAVAGTRNAR